MIKDQRNNTFSMIKDQRNNTFSMIKDQRNNIILLSVPIICASSLYCTSLYKKHANPKFICNFWDYNPKNHI